MLVVIYGFPNSGETFLNWSLHYLTGQKKLCLVDGRHSDVCDDPNMDGRNAHGHMKNTSHLKKIPSFHQVFENFMNHSKDCNGTGILHLYSKFDQAEALALSTCVGSGGKVLVLSSNYDFVRQHDRGRASGVSKFDHCQQQLKMIFGHGLDLTKIKTPGQLREFCVFNMKNLTFRKPNNFIDDISVLVPNKFVLRREDLVLGYQQSVRDCIKWLGLSVVEGNLEHWLTVAECWAATVSKYLNNDARWPYLVRAVIEGTDHDCGGLSIIQEGALIYDVLVSSGYLIKARHLETLPSNAADINKLMKK